MLCSLCLNSAVMQNKRALQTVPGLRDCNVSYDATFSASPAAAAAAASAVPMLTRELVTRIKKGVQR